MEATRMAEERIALPPFNDRDSNAKRPILVAEGLEIRFVKDLLECGTRQFIPFTGLGFEMPPAFGLPAFFLSRLELPTFLGIANELRCIQSLHGSLNFNQRRRLTYFIDQDRCEIGLRARQIANKFQKAHGLGHTQSPTAVFRIVFESLSNLINVSALFI